MLQKIKQINESSNNNTNGNIIVNNLFELLKECQIKKSQAKNATFSVDCSGSTSGTWYSNFIKYAINIFTNQQPPNIVQQTKCYGWGSDTTNMNDILNCNEVINKIGCLGGTSVALAISKIINSDINDYSQVPGLSDVTHHFFTKVEIFPDMLVLFTDGEVPDEDIKRADNILKLLRDKFNIKINFVACILVSRGSMNNVSTFVALLKNAVNWCVVTVDTNIKTSDGEYIGKVEAQSEGIHLDTLRDILKINEYPCMEVNENMVLLSIKNRWYELDPRDLYNIKITEYFFNKQNENICAQIKLNIQTKCNDKTKELWSNLLNKWKNIINTEFNDDEELKKLQEEYKLLEIKMNNSKTFVKNLQDEKERLQKCKDIINIDSEMRDLKLKITRAKYKKLSYIEFLDALMNTTMSGSSTIQDLKKIEINKDIEKRVNDFKNIDDIYCKLESENALNHLYHFECRIMMINGPSYLLVNSEQLNESKLNNLVKMNNIDMCKLLEAVSESNNPFTDYIIGRDTVNAYKNIYGSNNQWTIDGSIIRAAKVTVIPLFNDYDTLPDNIKNNYTRLCYRTGLQYTIGLADKHHPQLVDIALALVWKNFDNLSKEVKDRLKNIVYSIGNQPNRNVNGECFKNINNITALNSANFIRSWFYLRIFNEKFEKDCFIKLLLRRMAAEMDLLKKDAAKIFINMDKNIKKAKEEYYNAVQVKNSLVTKLNAGNDENIKNQIEHMDTKIKFLEKECSILQDNIIYTEDQKRTLNKHTKYVEDVNNCSNFAEMSNLLNIKELKYLISNTKVFNNIENELLQLLKDINMIICDKISIGNAYDDDVRVLVENFCLKHL
jgi:hypothetical protein